LASLGDPERSMTRTVLLGGLYHETHTFLSRRTTLADFEAMAVNIGPDIVANNLGNQSPTDGFLSHALGKGWEIVPTIQMTAMPSGTVEDEVLEVFRRHFFPVFEENLDRLDGIFLILHGAMVSAGSDDPEGELLRDIRGVLTRRGIDVPVVGVLDLHANVSQAMIDNSTCLVAYRENPHNDARETAVRAARIFDELMTTPGMSQVHRATEWILPPTGVGTADDPMKAVLAAAREIEARDKDIVNINVMAGYSYADVPDCGFSLAAATRGDPAVASGYLDELVDVLERQIEKAYPKDADLGEVLAKIDGLPPGNGPVLLVEPADNIGGGTPGDATDLLGPLLATGRKGIVAVIADPGAVAECAAAGLGANVSLTIGAKTDQHHGSPLPFTGRVRNLTDGKFELENKRSHLASMLGSHADMGPCAVVENEQAVVLLTSRKMPPMDLGQVHSQGVRPEDASYVIVKAAVSHRDAYNPIMRATFNVDSAGLCTSNLRRLPYQKIMGKRVALP
jgi:microcystin degradation protein MlrC